mmetsp:Transcript_12555/g.17449  ORF Transcript_12555/g.17449 Transcript_12555/m.17449 type:complete len:457 (-) Transcript_12555:283-1653(-)|eukprot:CAMPEP_0185263976 /NCGR_PEP_ID=MMETSP1359-20130426/17005_1 /TAXON_ID=552665 /ORGANISM="Bigelowiella longifila, Strain CCMP242" /LENGTH=456 /DNA_ID=CAMNT_0027851897 /DNA_START=22 /DNA_END=1392 /DNA_ORIENTATION=-
MRSSPLLLLALPFLFASEVKVLTTKNFDETIKDNQNVLVEFYAPWCGHCKRLAPEYDAASLKLKDEDVVLAKVDATEESELGQKYEVRGYPTLIWFKNGKSKEYDGGRTSDTIVSWVMKKIGPVLTEVDSAASVEEFKKKSDAVVVAYLTGDDVATLKEAAESLDNPVAIIKDEAVAKEAGVEGIVVFKTFDEGKVAYSGDMKAADIMKFVSGESIPLVMTWKDNQEMMGKIEAPLFFSGHDGSDVEKLHESMKKAAKPYKGEFLFYSVDTTEKANGRLLEFFGLETGKTVIFSQADRKKYFHDDVSTLSTFLEGYKAGTLTPTYKSEEIPEDNSAPVTVLVGKNFDAIVKDSKKDVLVEFYAPWCGHCKSLAPTYDKLGEHYKDDDNIVIAKMDSTANEVSEPEVRGFPTLYFFPADNKAGVKYEAGRDLEDFISYIDENRKSSKAATAEGHDEL